MNNISIAIREFCQARAWDPYHGPKDLAIGLVTEAAELLEHFRFRNETESLQLLQNPESREQVEDELIDSLFFILRFADKYSVDINQAFERKMLKNAKKYPAPTKRPVGSEVR